MRLSRLIMAALYIGSGLTHLACTSLFARAVPAYLPAHHALVLVSGVFEIAGGLGLLLRPTQSLAAWGLIALLVAVSPANLWMAQHPQLFPRIPSWALWLRLPLQLPLIAWAWLYTRRATRPDHSTARSIVRPQ
jgi:uncharacterized membrane protein